MEFFIGRYNQRFHKNIQKISQSAVEALSSYEWPGNIRELENMIERLVAITDGDSIHLEDIPIDYRFNSFNGRPQNGVFEKATEAFHQSLILRALEREGWNQIATAKTLGLPLSTLKYKMKRLNLRKRHRLKT